MTFAQWWFVPEAEMQCNHLCESVCYLSLNADTKRIATPLPNLPWITRLSFY